MNNDRWEDAYRCQHGHIVDEALQRGRKTCQAVPFGQTDMRCGGKLRRIRRRVFAEKGNGTHEKKWAGSSMGEHPVRIR